MPYSIIPFGSLVTLLQSRLQNSAFWTGVELRSNLNEGFKILQLGTLFWKARFVCTTIAGQVFYDLTATPPFVDVNGNPLTLLPLRVAFDQAPLDFCAITDMDNGGIPNWQLQTTGTVGAPDAPQLWGLNGLSYLYVWPADGLGNRSLVVDAAVRAPFFALDGSEDAKTVDMDSGMVSPFLDYSQHLCQIKRGPQQVKATMGKLKSFMNLLALTNSLFGASAVFKEFYALQQDRKTRPRQISDFTGVPAGSGFR